jgi:hypothetical protein
VQLSAQQTLAISVIGASERLFALSQQSISPFIFSVCRGIPDTMLPHNARNRKIDVSRLNTNLKYSLFSQSSIDYKQHYRKLPNLAPLHISILRAANASNCFHQ